jgi:hypothetical protein
MLRAFEAGVDAELVGRPAENGLERPDELEWRQTQARCQLADGGGIAVDVAQDGPRATQTADASGSSTMTTARTGLPEVPLNRKSAAVPDDPLTAFSAPVSS